MKQSNLFGNDLFGNPLQYQKPGELSKKFIIPPFSVLNARDGDWQVRKRAWLAMGIKGEEGRESELLKLSKTIHREKTVSGTSIFDPVLCELAYTWFCPPGGQVLDPFAGGSVRGIVAAALGLSYHGIELRAEQVKANETQKVNIMPGSNITWACGDSMDLLESAPSADFIFSCPPYGDLEKYSDDPADLSNMEYHTFIAAYKRIIMRAVAKLKNNRLACFVVGDFRNPKTGMYRGFVADTIRAFQEQGMELYNEAILLTAVGSLPIRVSGQFEKSRKLGKTHQNVMVFAKGTPDWTGGGGGECG